jgi:starch phosphorylase
MTAADFRSFVNAHSTAESAYRKIAQWTAMSIRNTAASGRFSTDRTIADYNADIWRLSPIELNGK